MSAGDQSDEPIGRDPEILLQAGGPCNICGQEMLIRSELVMGTTGGGFGMQLKKFTDCACGLRPLARPDA